MTAPATLSPKETVRNVLVCILMFILTVGGIAYVIIRDGILEEQYGKHNLRAYTNLVEEFAVAVVFLLAPFIGGCCAFRLTKAAKRSTRINGWLLVVMFAVFLLQAATVYWTRYQSSISLFQR